MQRMRIYVNQAGYLPESKKVVVLAEEAKKAEEAQRVKKTETGAAEEILTERKRPEKISVLDRDGECILEKEAVYWGYDVQSGDFVWKADISGLNVPGEYRILWARQGIACPLFISEGIYGVLCKTLCKALYFQRCGMALEERYAGKFRRNCCHTGTAVRLEDYKSLIEEPSADIPRFDVRGGWHDAGDYGRYPTAAATALAHILYGYRFFREAFTESLNIPESGNGMPDVLNECLYELRWLLKMQMPDGSVCHKLTSMRHANFVMPAEDRRQFILFPVSSMATADFAAVMALASRTYAQLDPQFSETALDAAKRAWEWLKKRPEFVGFENPAECNTGDYADTDDRDERMWAAAELYRTTGNVDYLNETERLFEELLAEDADVTAMGWGNVSGLAGWCMLEGCMCSDGTDSDGEMLVQNWQDAFVKEADRIEALSNQNGYGVALAKSEYEWGSNMTVLNRAMILGSAYILTRDARYAECAEKQMNYILGVNATGYSYVSGVGERAFCNPHNRVTVADGIRETIPGFVSGGPNASPCDEKAEWLILPGTPPMKCYLDIWECYSLNEITIYWNSPAIFAAAFLNTVNLSPSTEFHP